MISFIKKLTFILSHSQKKKTIFFLFLSLIGMILETIGVGIIVPVVSIIIDPDSFQVSNFLFLNELDPKEKIIFGFLIILALFFIKFLFQFYLIFYQSRFVYKLKEEISNKLFEFYLKQKYSFFLNKNSSEIIRNVNTEVMYFGFSLIAATNIIIDFLIFIGISLLILFINPKETLIIISIFIFIITLYLRFIKKKNYAWGIKRQIIDGKLLKSLQQIFLNIKYIKSFNFNKNISNEFKINNKESANLDINYNLIQNLPRVSLEVIAVIALLLSIIFMFDYDTKNSSQLIITLSLYAAAAFRLLPTLNRILNNFQTFRYYKPSIELLNKELKGISNIINDENRNLDELNFKKSLMLSNLNFKYPEKAENHFEAINLTISKSSIIGIKGESGSGKTTLLDILTGIIEPTSGKILIDEKIIENSNRLRKIVSYVPQKVFLLNDTIKRNIEFYSDIKNESMSNERVTKLIDVVNLRLFLQNSKNSLDTIIGEDGSTISGGQKQRIGIARALFKNPKILILDEATSGIDDIMEKNILKNIKDNFKDITIILASHKKSTLENCDEIYLIENKKIKKC